LRKYHEDRDFGEFVLQKGDTIISNSYCIQNDERYIDNPNIFNPDNFSIDNINKRIGTEREIIDHSMLKESFSYGRRKCVGFRIASYELRIQIAKIFYKYKIELEPKDQKF